MQQSVRYRQNIITLGFALVILCACGSSEIKLGQTGNVHDAVEAATGPLEDLNFKRRDIPEVLQRTAIHPYARPVKMSCDALLEEISGLDEVLGPDIAMDSLDLNAPEGIMDVKRMHMPNGSDIVDGAGNLVHDVVMTTIHSQTNILPLRSIVRKVTGADRYQRKVEQAYEVGKLRRAYLKGFAQDHYGTSCLTGPHVVEAKAAVTPHIGKSDSDE